MCWQAAGTMAGQAPRSAQVALGDMQIILHTLYRFRPHHAVRDEGDAARLMISAALGATRAALITSRAARQPSTEPMLMRKPRRISAITSLMP